MIKDYDVPLTDEQRSSLQDAMNNLGTLAEVTRAATVWRTVNYLMEEKTALKAYLTSKAGLFTMAREYITFQSFTKSVFHVRQKRRWLNKEFLALLEEVIDCERKTQKYLFARENHLQTVTSNNLWKMYTPYGDTFRLTALDFTKVRQPSLRYELKYYFRHIFEHRGNIRRDRFDVLVLALNTLAVVNPTIVYFSDISESDMRAMLIHLENITKKDGSSLSQKTMADTVMSVGNVMKYLMGNLRGDEIKAPIPHENPAESFVFHNHSEYTTPTTAIPEDVIEQIGRYTDELSPIHKLLYEIFTATGLRVKEVFFLEADCIEPSRYKGICQLKFIPHKTLASRRRQNAGDYHRVMIPQPLADKIACHINDTTELRKRAESKYIFLSRKPGYSQSVMNPTWFIETLRKTISKHNICDENGELWHLTNMQFRKTVAVTLIENGATTAELAYWLGHMSSSTAAKYYAEVRKMKLAELNTKFFKQKFDLIMSSEQLEEYSEEERKLLYIDFRLEQRRVELGYCLVKAADGGCVNRNNIYNCVNCKNLCTGKKYLPYWADLLAEQQAVFDALINTYQANSITDYEDYTEYKQEYRLLKGYGSIVGKITEGGGPNA